LGAFFKNKKMGLFNKKKTGGGAFKKEGFLRTAAQSVAVAPVLVPLAIFIPVMKKALKDKKITPKKAPIDLVKQFYEEIVTKSKENLEIDHMAVAAAVSIETIVQAILKYFKKLKEKKDKANAEIAAGKKPSNPLTPTEEKIVEGGEAAVNSAKGYAKDEATFQLGKVAPFAIGGLLLFVIAVLYFRS
jgi:hypothetical protein